MEMSSNIWHTFVLIGAIQGFILTAFLLLHKKGNRTANRVLAILIFSISADMLISFLYLSHHIDQLPHLISVSEPLYTLYGPLLYLYTKLLTTPQFKFKSYHILFFIPAILEAILWIPFYLQPAELKLQEYKGLTSDEQTVFEYWLIWNLELIYNMAFVFIAAIVLKKHARNIKNLFSDISRISFKWLRNLIFATLLVSFFQVAIIILSAFDIATIETYFIILYCFIALFFYGIGYMGLRQPEVFSGIEIVMSKTSLAQPQKKYVKSALTGEMAQSFLQKLLQLMVSEKLYLQSDLKLKDVADRLSVSTNHLSQVINEKLGKNFFDFINSYRVQEAKKMLADPDYKHLTLLAIAFDAGFSSKSSFNKIFKDHTGLTPSQYQRRHLAAAVSKS